MSRLSTFVGVLALLGPARSGRTEEPHPPALAVIVHRSRPDTPTLREIARIYLRQKRLWRDGTPIAPLNRQPGTPERELFSRRVLGGASTRLASYWNEAYFNGVLPPLVLSSGAAVTRYVAQEPHAIGYVTPPDLDDSVRVVLTLDAEGRTGGEPETLRPRREQSEP